MKISSKIYFFLQKIRFRLAFNGGAGVDALPKMTLNNGTVPTGPVLILLFVVVFVSF